MTKKVIKQNLICKDCGVKKKDTQITGSFLCENCQEKQFERLRQKYGKNTEKNTEERVLDNMELVLKYTKTGFKRKGNCKKDRFIRWNSLSLSKCKQEPKTKPA